MLFLSLVQQNAKVSEMFCEITYWCFYITQWSPKFLFKALKSDNLRYNTLGRWDDRLIDQVSDVPNIIFKLAVRLRTSGASKNPDSCHFFPASKLF